MENENKNIITPQTGPTTDNLQVYMSEARKKRKRNILIGVLVVLCVGVAAYFGYTNPQLFKAEITEVEVPAGTAEFYIPSYEAGAGDSGTISVKARGDITEAFDSIAFKLTYNPTTALIFATSPLVFDSTTVVDSALFDMAEVNSDDELVVAILLSEPITMSEGETLFKLNVQISPDLPMGQVVNLAVEDFAVYNSETDMEFGIDVGNITVGGTSALKVLNAQATSPTSVTVRFSDLLTNFGAASNYKIYIRNTDGTLGTPLAVSAAALAPDQQSVILTTVAQDAGTSYVVIAAGDVITSNTQGGLNPAYDTALFYDYSVAAAALSDFGMASALATSYNQFKVTFTDNVVPASVLLTNFTLKNINTNSNVAISGATVSAANEVTITVTDDLLKKYTYLLTATANTVQRVGVPAVYLGVNSIALTGYGNGPKISSVTYGTGSINITFDENIQASGVDSSSYGRLYLIDKGTDHTLDNSYLINSASSITHTITGTTMTLTDPMFGYSDVHFVFSVSKPEWITNSLGVSTDSAFKTISFWGNGHTGAPTVGDVTIENKKTVKVTPGTLDFAGLSYQICSSYTDLTSCTTAGCSFGCSGTPSCSNLSVAPDMCTPKGCLNIGGLCTGDFDCENITAVSQCEGVVIGCEWDGEEDPPCTGTPAVCTTIPSENNCKNTGCLWGCKGTPTANRVSVWYADTTDTLKEQALSSVGMAGSDLQIAFNQNLQPDRLYVLKITDTAGKTLLTKRFYMNQNLDVVSAEATDTNKITVELSKNVDSATVDATDFSITPDLTVSGVTFGIGDYTHVVLTTSANMSGSTVYTVSALDNTPAADFLDDVYAYDGSALSKNTASFAGYGGTSSSLSSVTAQSVANPSGTTVNLTFSGALNVATATSPINVKIVSADASYCTSCGGTAPACTIINYLNLATCTAAGCSWSSAACSGGVACTPTDPTACAAVSGCSWSSAACSGIVTTCSTYATPTACAAATGCSCQNSLTVSPLTITSIVNTGGNNYQLTTSTQTAGKNYFVIMNGVKDASGLNLGNAKVLNFFGFESPEPVITNVSPSVVTNDVDQTITLTGQNFDVVATVKVGSQIVDVQSKTDTSIVFTLPADFDDGSYAIILIDEAANSKSFPNALLVGAPETPMQIISELSLAIPFNIPPDGETETTLWALVQDPIGLDDISSVTVNLSQIGGVPSQPMTKATGTQPPSSQWYKYTLTVPVTAVTKSAPYLLPVQAKKGDETVNGTVSIHVTGDVYQSEAPVVNSAYVSPVSVPPDGETAVKISAQVTDTDGADSIASVVANLGPLGLGFVNLSAIEAGTGAELMTKFYESEEFTVPTTTAVGAYTINIVASDLTGESVTQPLTLNVSTSLTGPVISATKSYVSRKSIPKDGVTPFSLNIYVTDPNGVSDVTNVTASFGSLGLDPITLIKDAGVAENAKSAFFKVANLTIPTTAPLGVHEIEITAEDTTGGLANYIIQIDVTSRDLLGDAPMIIEDKGYTTPAVAINDGTTPITLYVFVRDDDDNLESVVANLAGIGQVGPETSAGFAETGSSGTVMAPVGGEGCSTGSNVMACMTPSFKEGSAGQWFVLSGVTISTTTAPSSEPYMIDIIATDDTNKVSHGDLPVVVSTSESFENDQLPPKIVAAVPTSNTKVEVLFNEEISANSISSSGAEFMITNKNDVAEELDIVSATINAAGNVVTLTTGTQTVGKEYALTATSNIKDAVGVSLVAGGSNKKFFKGFQAKGKVPIVDYATATDIDMVEIEFQDAIKPSSVKLSSDTGGDPNFEIFEADTSSKLEVLSVSFGDSSNVIVLKTANQKSDFKYRVQIKGIESYDGKKSDGGTSKTFKSLNIRTIQRQAAGDIGDFDGNGSVDFSDFTIFSSVYGMSYLNGGGAPAETAPETGGEPIPPEPDATVPVTSEPTGGELPAE